MRPPFNRKDCLTVCVVGLPYLSNFTDFTALENVPGVVVYYTRRPEEARAADVLILPGSKNTIPDLLWLRKNDWEPVIESHAAAGKPLVGIMRRLPDVWEVRYAIHIIRRATLNLYGA